MFCVLSIPLVHIPSTARFIMATDKCFANHIRSILTITDKLIGYILKQTSQTINSAHISDIVNE